MRVALEDRQSVAVGSAKRLQAVRLPCPACSVPGGDLCISIATAWAKKGHPLKRGAVHVARLVAAGFPRPERNVR